MACEASIVVERLRDIAAPHVDATTPQPEDDDERAFLRAAKRFASGVTVVTARSPLGFHGTTVSSFTFVSRDPRLILVSLSVRSSLLPPIEAAGSFAVSVLAAGDHEIAERFAKRAARVDSAFTDVPHRFAETGAPVLAGAIGWFDCRVAAMHPAGDHVLVIGAVCAAGEREGCPLLYHRSRYATLAE